MIRNFDVAAVKENGRLLEKSEDVKPGETNIYVLGKTRASDSSEGVLFAAAATGLPVAFYAVLNDKLAACEIGEGPAQRGGGKVALRTPFAPQIA